MDKELLKRSIKLEDKKGDTTFRVLVRYTLFLIGLFGLVFFFVFFSFSQPGKEFRLIDFRGMDIIEAVRWLEERDLDIAVYKTIDSQIPAFHIISQRPEPGMLVKERRTITLVVSQGESARKMPDFSGKNFLTARNDLYALLSGYITVPEIVKVERFSSNVEEGRIISHTPVSGQVIDFDREIVFVVSKGISVQDFFVKDYRLKNYSEVFDELSRIGIEVRAKFLPAEQASGIGKIFKQDVPPKTQLNKGDVISFVVGVAKDKVSEEITKKDIERLRIYTLRIPVKVKEKKSEPPSAGDASSTEETSPASNRRHVKLYVDDALGRRLSFSRFYLEGSLVQMPYSSLGKGTVEVFIDEEPFEKKSF